jgi:sarcosine oxidase subunit alpha
MTGRVTSCNYSPTLQKPIGLAYVTPENTQAGSTFIIKSSGGVRVTAEVVELPFYDPDTLRQEL